VPERYELAAPEVIADLIDGEAVAIDLTSGHYHRLQGAAADVWGALLEGASVEEIRLAASAPLGDDALAKFVAALVAAGLLRERTASPSGAATPWAPGPLVLETFDDLEDILGIDPIHEVDPDRGWPNLPGA
jgi:hypothetical protein